MFGDVAGLLNLHNLRGCYIMRNSDNEVFSPEAFVEGECDVSGHG